MEKCDRCNCTLQDGKIMSIFKNETICLSCKRKETQTKEYREILNFIIEKEFLGKEVL